MKNGEKRSSNSQSSRALEQKRKSQFPIIVSLQLFHLIVVRAERIFLILVIHGSGKFKLKSGSVVDDRNGCFGRRFSRHQIEIFRQVLYKTPLILTRIYILGSVPGVANVSVFQPKHNICICFGRPLKLRLLRFICAFNSLWFLLDFCPYGVPTESRWDVA